MKTFRLHPSQFILAFPRRPINSDVIRLTSMTKFILTIALILLPHVAFAQKTNQPSLGWDLTYNSVLNANRIGRGEWIRKWLGPGFQSPIKKYISAWNGEPIESSILIEHPAFHAAEHITF